MKKPTKNLDIAIVLGLAAVLLLWGLGTPMFWSDEAITAVYSRNTLRYGWPRAFDGRNLCAYGDGASISARDLGAWGYPLLQFYTTAASFAVFGEATWAGRLPHALLGVGSVALLFSVGLRLTRNRTVALLAALALALTPQFLLFARNCRYFSLTAFLALAWLWLYLRLPERRWGEWYRTGWTGAGLGLATVLLFHAHFLVAAVFCAAAAGAILAARRDWRRLPTLVPVGAASVLVCAAWIVWVVRPTGVGAPAEGHGFLSAAWTRLLWYARDLNFTGMLPVGLLGVLLAIWGWGRLASPAERTGKPRKRGPRLTPNEKAAALFAATLAVFHVLMTAALSDEPPIEGTIDANIRYAMPILPLTALLGAVAATALTRWHKWAGAAFLAVWLGTNALSLCPPRVGEEARFRSFLGEYIADTFRLAEIPPTSTEAVARLLRDSARQDDLVFMWPEYRQDPFIFYLGDRLLFCGVLAADDERIVPRAEELGLPSYVYATEVEPDWIIGFGLYDRGGRSDIREHVGRQRAIREGKERVMRIWWDDTSRPELTRRRMRPPEPARMEQGVLIVERKRD